MRLPRQAHLAGIGSEHPRDEIEQRGLAGAVRADQRVQLTILDRQVHAVHGSERAEALGHAPGIPPARRETGRCSRRKAGASWPGCGRDARRHGRRAARLRRSGAVSALAESDQAERGKQDQRHEQQAEPELPGCGVTRHQLAEQQVERSAPSAGPRKLPMPPTIVIARISPEKFDVHQVGRHEQLEESEERSRPARPRWRR